MMAREGGAAAVSDERHKVVVGMAGEVAFDSDGLHLRSP